MDTPYRAPGGLLGWLDIVTMAAGTSFTQTPPGRYRSSGHDDYAAKPSVAEFALDAPTKWTRLDAGGDIEVTGRLIGGCIETICNLAGTPYGNVGDFARRHAPDGLLVYVEAAEHDPARSAATCTECVWQASSRAPTP